jgi:hypothetical protein
MDNLIFKLSQIGFAFNCNIAFTNRCPHLITVDENKLINKISNLSQGDSVFISPNETNFNLDKLLHILKEKNIKIDFYILNEPIIEKNLVDILLPYTNHMFLQNNIYNHPQIHNMPIGIRDCGKVFLGHKGFYHDFLLNEGKKVVDKEILCLLCFTFTHDDRYTCYNELKDKQFIKNINENQYEKQESIHCGKVPVWINYEYTHKSHYVLSPRGYGEATHRFFEAIYLDTMPIVKRTNTAFDKLYNIFPCLIINEWNEVTEELLINNKEDSIDKIVEFKKKYPNAFTDLSSIYDLLLLT